MGGGTAEEQPKFQTFETFALSISSLSRNLRVPPPVALLLGNVFLNAKRALNGNISGGGAHVLAAVRTTR